MRGAGRFDLLERVGRQLRGDDARRDDSKQAAERPKPSCPRTWPVSRVGECQITANNVYLTSTARQNMGRNTYNIDYIALKDGKIRGCAPLPSQVMNDPVQGNPISSPDPATAKNFSLDGSLLNFCLIPFSARLLITVPVVTRKQTAPVPVQWGVEWASVCDGEDLDETCRWRESPQERAMFLLAARRSGAGETGSGKSGPERAGLEWGQPYRHPRDASAESVTLTTDPGTLDAGCHLNFKAGGYCGDRPAQASTPIRAGRWRWMADSRARQKGNNASRATDGTRLACGRDTYRSGVKVTPYTCSCVTLWTVKSIPSINQRCTSAPAMTSSAARAPVSVIHASVPAPSGAEVNAFGSRRGRAGLRVGQPAAASRSLLEATVQDDAVATRQCSATKPECSLDASSHTLENFGTTALYGSGI
ncbi:hypothetical protein Bbelb_169290 [Branchiostoma belcheri]|nr:hypothetical protein Bbelb_169290 [Branchiostoma belcheri]